MTADTNATELFVDRLGLFGHVITVLDAPSSHVPILKRFLSFRFEFEILNVAHTMTAMILIDGPLHNYF